jgi:hypothetical protein
LRRLTGADVPIENKLFATLDTTTRKIALPNKQPCCSLIPSASCANSTSTCGSA